MSSRALRLLSLIAVTLLAGAIIGARVDPVRDAIDNAFNSEEVSSEALDVIEENYFQNVDPAELQSDSIRALVQELKKKYKDRFTHYFGPEAFARFKQVTEGHFSGVGLSVTEVKEGLRVATVFDKSPAKDAGIEEGELIVAVDGRSIAGESSEQATAEIKGRPGTDVTLTVRDPQSGAERDLTLTRRELEVPAVEGKLEEVNGVPVAYVRLLSFSEGAHAQLRDKLEQLYARGAQGTALDLRGNGGGLLTEAVLTSSVFVEDGTIVSTEGRTQGEETFEAVGEALPEHPTVVLINHDTASASEILAAALQEAGLARVVGQTSFGKGTFQEVIQLDNGGALDLTVGEYRTRDGTSINGTGIQPEVPAKDVPATQPDEGLDQALQVLGQQL